MYVFADDPTNIPLNGWTVTIGAIATVGLPALGAWVIKIMDKRKDNTKELVGQTAEISARIESTTVTELKAIIDRLDHTNSLLEDRVIKSEEARMKEAIECASAIAKLQAQIDIQTRIMEYNNLNMHPPKEKAP